MKKACNAVFKCDTDEQLTRSEKKHLDIIAAAEQVFIEFGYQQASMNKIAEVANVTKRTVYKHFANKEELFDFIIRKAIDEVFEMGDIDYIPEGDLRPQLVAMLYTVWESVTQEKMIKLKRVVIAEYVRVPEFISPILDDLENRDEGLKRWLQQAIDYGHVVDGEKQLMFELLVGMIEQVSQVPLIFDRPVPDDAAKEFIINEIADLFILKYGGK